MESPEQTESRRRRDGKERGQRSESLHDPKPDSLYAHFGLVCFALIDAIRERSRTNLSDL